jgi:superfamily II DNA helicase RecQ
VKVIAMTATANKKTRVAVTKKLMMDNPFVVDISPEKPNIYMAVVRATTIDKIAELLSVGLHNQGKDYPKTLIFCRRLVNNP